MKVYSVSSNGHRISCLERMPTSGDAALPLKEVRLAGLQREQKWLARVHLSKYIGEDCTFTPLGDAGILKVGNVDLGMELVSLGFAVPDNECPDRAYLKQLKDAGKKRAENRAAFVQRPENAFFNPITQKKSNKYDCWALERDALPMGPMGEDEVRGELGLVVHVGARGSYGAEAPLAERGDVTMVIALQSGRLLETALYGLTPIVDGLVANARFHEELIFFLAFRLLSRLVTVTVRSHVLTHTHTAKSYYSSIGHPKGDIAVSLVRNGFFKVDEGRLHRIRGEPACTALLEAQTAAAAARTRIWAIAKMPVNASPVAGVAGVAGPRSEGTVTEVINNGCLVVSTGGTTKRVYLAGCVCLRNYDVSAFEKGFLHSKDVLRRVALGRPVWIQEEGKREPREPREGEPKPDAKKQRTDIIIGSVYLDAAMSLCLNSMMATAGLVELNESVPAARRPEWWSAAASGAAAALRAGTGMHAGAAALVHDASQRGAGDYALRWFGARARTVPAVCEYVFGADKLKVRIQEAKDRVLLANVVLAGVRAAERGGPGKTLTNERCFQKDVLLDIKSCDKHGTLSAVVYTSDARIEPSDPKLMAKAAATPVIEKTNDLAVELLKAGWVSAENEAYRPLQTEAVAAKKGFWTQGGPEARKSPLFDVRQVRNPWWERKDGDVAAVTLAEVDGAVLTLRPRADNAVASALRAKLADLSSLPFPAQNASFRPRAGQLCLCRVDGRPLRGQILKRLKISYEVLALDVGTTHDVLIDDLAPLAAHADLLAEPPLVWRSTLAGCKCPSEHIFGVSAELGLLSDGNFTARYEGPHGSCLAVTLFTPRQTQSVNETLVLKGVCLFDKASPTPLSEQLQHNQKIARNKHLNIWRHGNIESDDE